MPLSDHEQRMLDQIESALYAEDPKFVSSVRGGALRAPTARRRLQGTALFVAGLALLVVGIAFRVLWIGQLPIVSVVGFVAMFAGAVFALTGTRALTKDKAAPPVNAGRSKRSKGGGSFTTRMEDRFRRRFDD